ARIGWAFLSQYYSFLNKDPARLHCFYTKRSTLLHSTEGEDATACYGQQEIHAKIMSLQFEDCKVYISNVDSQSSAEGGILVQVIGEMSNANGPWRKFAQTFFLAGQHNGYFVLNDICRYIKEEGDEGTEAFVPPRAESSTAEEEAVEPAPTAAATAPPAQATPAPAPVESAPAETAPEPAGPQSTAPSAAAPSSTAGAPSAAAPPSAPAAPKSWASLAAAGSNKWGKVTSETKGASPSTERATPSTAGQAAASPAPFTEAVMAVKTPSCFVKGVVEAVTDQLLKDTLTTRFGPLKELDIVRSKACAFIEFEKLDHARKAIQVSMRPSEGGEGAIFI
ncbi:NTF2-domain-containing protein, partial [Rhodotorula sp. JG-1b]